RIPDRSGLPALKNYAHLQLASGERRIVGYTEASRGCRHMCRHCPVVQVYGGAFRVVQPEIVLADIRRQVAAGAEHITFGDPDFFNGPGHALAVVKALHREFPALTYDVTIKIEHLLKFSSRLPVLLDTGCAFVTSAAESLDDPVLALLEKGHTRSDFFRAVELMQAAGLPLAPTFIPFTPWTTLAGYQDLLRQSADAGLVENVSPVQFAIRLLIPQRSRLLELPEVRARIDGFDGEMLSYRWRNPDPTVDELQAQVEQDVAAAGREGLSRSEAYSRIWNLACEASAASAMPELPARATIPFLTEPWYC
ncbi:MAG: radical SAM protein, partial [Acidobacteria bacterium]|nr:radical SAM protein [Acidobacteriota bacterium]